MVSDAYEYQFANEAYAEIFGLDPRNIVGRRVPELLPSGWSQIQPRLDQALAGKRVGYELTLPALPGDSAPQWFRVMYEPRTNEAERPTVVVVVIDITELKRTAEAIRESEERFRQMAENMREVFWLSEPGKRKVLYVTPAYETVWGRPRESLYIDYGGWLSAIHPEDRARVQAASVAKETTGVFDEVYRVVHPDGSIRWVHDRGFPVRDEAGKAYRVAGVAEDITERRQAEEDARAALMRMRAVFASAADGLILADAQGNLLEWNPAALRLHGYQSEAEVRRPLAEFAANFALSVPGGPPLPFHDWPLSRVLRGEQLTEHELNVRRSDIGREWVISFSGTPIRNSQGAIELAVLTLHDVTAHRRVEDQLRQAQKMEAVGQLAGGIAHDFNNLVTIISGYSELLLTRLPGEGPAIGMVRTIADAGKRAAALTQQLLAFSRRTLLEPKLLDLNQIVKDSEKLLRRLIGEDVSLTTVLAPMVPHIKADPGLLGQVIMNLAVNARDAMPTGGKLTIETSVAYLTEEYVQSQVELRSGRYALLAVSDTGCGMSPEVLARIWEPFFTTKEVGKRHWAWPGRGSRHRQAVGRPRRGLQRTRGWDHLQDLPAGRGGAGS